MTFFNTESLQVAMKDFRGNFFLNLMDQTFKLLYTKTYNNTVNANLPPTAVICASQVVGVKAHTPSKGRNSVVK